MMHSCFMKDVFIGSKFKEYKFVNETVSNLSWSVSCGDKKPRSDFTHSTVNMAIRTGSSRSNRLVSAIAPYQQQNRSQTDCRLYVGNLSWEVKWQVQSLPLLLLFLFRFCCVVSNLISSRYGVPDDDYCLH